MHIYIYISIYKHTHRTPSVRGKRKPTKQAPTKSKISQSHSKALETSKTPRMLLINYKYFENKS